MSGPLETRHNVSGDNERGPCVPPHLCSYCSGPSAQEQEAGALHGPQPRDPTLVDPSLRDPSLVDPSLTDPSLADPSLMGPGLP